MADSEGVVTGTVDNLTAAAANGTAKPPATPEGILVSCGSLFLMAIIPIFIGSFRSVAYHKEQKESGEKPETMSQKDAAMFPIIASCALFGIYLVFQIFSKEYINLLLTAYFFFLGVLALAHIAGPVFSKLFPATFPNKEYSLVLTQGASPKKEDLLNYQFDRKDLVTLAICGLVGIWYLIKKHWIANNLFGVAFAVNGVELLSLNRVTTGCILLCGLFFYDIFWVFGTNVMVTVARSFEAPIKFVFPQDILERGLTADNFSMLGLGDVVIPGIFVALMLRFDLSLKRNTRVYFYSCFVAYCLGLALTMFILHYFKHAQPALLYLVPCCLGLPIAVASLKGDIKAMFEYEDHPDTSKTKETSKTK
ncbi:hypothetical protein BsWGS_02560 [Bradybaena similaris]